jgi:hypothetical protein
MVNVVQKSRKNNYCIKLVINGVPHEFQFDTGCDDTILSEDFWKSLGSPPLLGSRLVFTAYTGTEFRPIGELEADVQYQGQVLRHRFPVCTGSSLFGKDLMGKIRIDWNSIQSQCLRVKSPVQSLGSLLTEFDDVFGPANGLIKNFKARVVLKDDAVPRFFKARPVPFAVRSKVDLEIDRLVESGVWSPVDTSEWASPLVIVPRSGGRIRITGDFKHTVNSQLHVTQYPLTRTSDLFASLTGGQKFSKLDGPDAFHQVELTEDSKKCMVVNTHRGLFCYNVLPMGISSSPAIFQ